MNTYTHCVLITVKYDDTTTSEATVNKFIADAIHLYADNPEACPVVGSTTLSYIPDGYEMQEIEQNHIKFYMNCGGLL